MQQHRGALRGEDAAAILGVSKGTCYKPERGTHGPSTDTARALARWLGWTVEHVLDAAGQPAPTEDTPNQTT